MTRGSFLLATAAALALPSAAQAQSFRHPSDCGDGCMTVSAYFDHGGRTDWSCGGHTYGGHPGTDFAIYGGFGAVDEGRGVVAAAPGTVVDAHDGEFDRCTTGDCAGGGGYGNFVELQHPDGRTTFYGHMRTGSVAVGVGDSVGCGQHLGFIASSGYSTGPHVHFEPRAGGSIDPFGGACSGGSAWVDQGGYLGLPSMACEAVCTPHCEGSVIVDSGCGHGDCGAYGATCTDDALGVRCVYTACPAIGDADVCLDETQIAHCHDGIPAPPGDCGVYAARCSTAGASAARCVSIFCAGSAAEAPTEHTTCAPDGRLLDCHADATIDASDCPAGQSCDAGRCVAPDAGTAPPDVPDGGMPPDGATSDGGAKAPATTRDGSVTRDGAVTMRPGMSTIHGGCAVAPAPLDHGALGVALAALGIALGVRRRPRRARVG